MNNIYEHEYSSEWKQAMDAISLHFNGLLDILSSNIVGYCKIKHAFNQSWDVNKLKSESKIYDDLSEVKDAYWWKEWLNLLAVLEDKFDIRLSKSEDFDEMFSPNPDERIFGLDYNLPIEKLAVVVSLLVSGRELSREFFLFDEIPDNSNDNLPDWSDSIKDQTKNVLIELPIPSFMKGYCIIKSLDHQYGKISLEDAVAFKYNIKDIDTNELIVSFDSLYELIEAGWVVD